MFIADQYKNSSLMSHALSPINKYSPVLVELSECHPVSEQG